MSHPLPSRFTRHASRLLAALTALALVAAVTSAAAPQERAISVKASFLRDAGQTINLDVTVGQSRVIEFEQPFDRALTSVEGIVSLNPVSTNMLVVSGVATGQVNLIAWGKPATEGEPRKMIVFSVYVQNNLSLIDNQIKILFPKENIQISQANGPVGPSGGQGGAGGNGIVVLSGSVTDPKYSEQAQKIIEAAGFKVVNMIRLPTLDSSQVRLEIRVAEVDRNVLREVGAAYGVINNVLPAFINPGGPASLGDLSQRVIGGSPETTLRVNPGSALNIFLGNANSSSITQGFIRALNQRGAVRSLAEPNLIAMNGKKARFLAGGEFPVPVIQGGAGGGGGVTAITIEYRQYGIKLDFTPTILDENHIQLELEPEVSSIDFSAGTQILNTVVPGRRIRQARTTLELRDGQSFALAGLIDNSEQVNLSKIPLLGDVPILGELFKSRRFQRTETELMFLVTVKLVEPLNPDQLPRLPGNVGELKTDSPGPQSAPLGQPGQPAPTALGAPANALAPALPAGAIEGQSGHALPRKGAPAQPVAKSVQEEAKP
jgi:pilus assembly protein CpaC